MEFDETMKDKIKVIFKIYSNHDIFFKTNTKLDFSNDSYIVINLLHNWVSKFNKIDQKVINKVIETTPNINKKKVIKELNSIKNKISYVKINTKKEKNIKDTYLNMVQQGGVVQFI